MSKHRGEPPGLAEPREIGETLVGRYLIPFSFGLTALYVVTLSVLALRGYWLIDDAGRGIAIDFVAFWGAGRLTLEGAASLAYDFKLLKAVQELGLGRTYAGYYPWLYPPFFLFAVTPMALLSYVPAFILWTASTLTAYLTAIRAILPSETTVVAAIAAPAVCWNASTGQNGLLTAALLAGGLALLERRPWHAGAFLGLLAYKPQFFLMIPVVLLVCGHWRALLGTSVTVAILVGTSTLLFGWDAWTAFFAALGVAVDWVLVDGAIGMFKIQSVYATLRFVGLTDGMAWGAQGVLDVVVTFGVLWLWRRPASASLKAAALSTGALAVTPYLLINDLAVLAVPVAFLAREGLSAGFRSGEVATLVGICLLPALFAIIPGPWGLLAYAALAILILRRAVAGSASGCERA